MKDTRKKEKTPRSHASVFVGQRDDDWLWMVAEDPAFYLEERDAPVAE